VRRGRFPTRFAPSCSYKHLPYQPLTSACYEKDLTGINQGLSTIQEGTDHSELFSEGRLPARIITWTVISLTLVDQIRDQKAMVFQSYDFPYYTFADRFLHNSNSVLSSSGIEAARATCNPQETYNRRGPHCWQNAILHNTRPKSLTITPWNGSNISKGPKDSEKLLIPPAVCISQICVLPYLILERLQGEGAHFRNAQVI
jgi:hypothetical protein